MAITKTQAEKSDVAVDHADVLKFVKDAIGEMLVEVAKKQFRLPLRFRMLDAQNDLLREFWIHKDGLELAPPTGKPNNLYLFPLVASVRDADGRTARMRINAQSAGSVQFAKGAPS